jgi:amino acid transporter
MLTYWFQGSRAAVNLSREPSRDSQSQEDNASGSQIDQTPNHAADKPAAGSEELASPKEVVEKYHANAFEVWALGITVVIGGQYFGWNFGLSAGFGSFSVAQMLIGTAYICLIVSMSEISSALPFAGGAYGLARCTLGFYPGFVIGFMEAVEYITYVATSVLSLGAMITEILAIDASYQPVIWLIFYITALAIMIPGGHVFWKSTVVLAVVSFLILVMYCLGGLKYVDFNSHAGYNDEVHVNTYHNMFVGGMNEFMMVLPLAAWFYVGVESLAFACDTIEKPRVNLPRGSISCVLTLFCCSIFVLFVSCSLENVSDLSTQLIVFNTGFSYMFKISSTNALILSLPATYATAFGFIFPYGKLLQALSSSRLLPRPFSWVTKEHHQPYFSLIAGSVLGYAISLLAYYRPDISSKLFNICILAGFTCYIAQCLGYIALQTKFQNLKRDFHSPLGIAGAVYAIIVFSIAMISVIAFQNDGQFAFITFVCLVTLLTVYYYAYAKKKQTFSKDEQKILFVAHVITWAGF